MSASVPRLIFIVAFLVVGFARASIDVGDAESVREAASELAAYHKVRRLRERATDAPRKAMPSPKLRPLGLPTERQAEPIFNPVELPNGHVESAPTRRRRPSFSVPANSPSPDFDASRPVFRPRPRPPLFTPPTSAVAYLRSDHTLSPKQRKAIDAATTRYARSQAALTEAMRERLIALNSATEGGMTAALSREIIGTVDWSRRLERRILRDAMSDLRVALNDKQWDRFEEWMRTRPWMPFVDDGRRATVAAEERSPSR